MTHYSFKELQLHFSDQVAVCRLLCLLICRVIPCEQRPCVTFIRYPSFPRISFPLPFNFLLSSWHIIPDISSLSLPFPSIAHFLDPMASNSPAILSLYIKFHGLIAQAYTQVSLSPLLTPNSSIISSPDPSVPSFFFSLSQNI